MAAAARHDRAVRGGPGARGRTAGASSPTARRATATTCAARDEFKVFTNINSTIVDPKNFDEKSFVDLKGDGLHHPAQLLRARAHGRVLPHPAQRARRSAWARATYARCGIIVNVTPFEPEWEGYVTLEFSNTTPLPAKIYANEGVAQMLFFESDEVCETSYRDRGRQVPGPAGRHAAQDLSPRGLRSPGNLACAHCDKKVSTRAAFCPILRAIFSEIPR